jgi:PhnB protein
MLTVTPLVVPESLHTCGGERCYLDQRKSSHWENPRSRLPVRKAIGEIADQMNEELAGSHNESRNRFMKLNPYLAFDGRCREAFEFYQKELGGHISFIQTIGESPMASSMPPEAYGRIMHVTLQIGDQVLQGADAPPGQFTKPAGFCVAAHFDDFAEGERAFNALAQHGKVQMPFQSTFWAKGFGMLIDQFGTPWILNAGQVTS